MNRELLNEENQSVKVSFFKMTSRKKDLLIICLLACFLMIAVWQVFDEDKKQGTQTAFNRTESEKKITQILSQIDGVGEVDVCDGANNLRVVMDIREAVCAALDIDAKDVKIYLKN